MLADSAIAEKQINAICEAIRKDYEQKGIVIEQPKAFYPSEANQDLWGC